MVAQNYFQFFMYDIVILGAGCVGLGAGVYAGRFNMKTLLMGELMGGTITTTHLVENYPGFVSLSGPELAEKLEQHARSVDIEIVNGVVIDIQHHGDCFSIHTKESEYRTKTVLYVTGTTYRSLDIPSVKRLENRGVSYCASCDGPLFKGKNLAVVGGGDSAAKESLLLAEFSPKVYIIVRGDRLKAEPINLKRVEKNPKIEVLLNTEVAEAIGENLLERIQLKNGNILDVQGLFIEIGRIPRTELAAKLGVELNSQKEIKINRNSETNIRGFYAAGDVTDTVFKQAITGVGEGILGVYSAYEYISSQNIECM